MDFVNYFIDNIDQISHLFVEHAQMTTLAVGFAIAIGVPLGILVCYITALKKPIIGTANVIQSVPSMAVLGLTIPIFGIGSKPAIIMVVIYSLLPIIKNTAIGISNINPDTLEAAKGIGLTRLQILSKVQIPLALPTIMAGIRISAVTSVGLMTIAAFVGGGGLGFLVFSGIRTMNNNQILAGALPACILALLVDYITGTMEQVITPKGIAIDKAPVNPVRKWFAILTVLAVLISMFSQAITTVTHDDEITIAGKDFTEQEILVHMLSSAIERQTDIHVNRQPNLGGSSVAFQALTRGDIDMYVEYTGTAFSDVLNYPIEDADVDTILEIVRNDFSEKYNIDVLDPFSFNNTFTLATRPDIAKQYNLTTISDLARVSDQLTISSTLEFLNRDDGLRGLNQAYNMSFKQEIGIDGSSRYTALMNNDSQIVDAFATDGLIKKLDLVILKDDLNFFPPYHAIPIIRQDTLTKYPEIAEILNALGPHLTEEVMIELNYQVDELGRSPITVADEFLDSIGW